jgi:hypothetical protein
VDYRHETLIRLTVTYNYHRGQISIQQWMSADDTDLEPSESECKKRHSESVTTNNQSENIEMGLYNGAGDIAPKLCPRRRTSWPPLPFAREDGRENPAAVAGRVGGSG